MRASSSDGRGEPGLPVIARSSDCTRSSSTPISRASPGASPARPAATARPSSRRAWNAALVRGNGAGSPSGTPRRARAARSAGRGPARPGPPWRRARSWPRRSRSGCSSCSIVLPAAAGTAGAARRAWPRRPRPARRAGAPTRGLGVDERRVAEHLAAARRRPGRARAARRIPRREAVALEARLADPRPGLARAAPTALLELARDRGPRRSPGRARRRRGSEAQVRRQIARSHASRGTRSPVRS